MPGIPVFSSDLQGLLRQRLGQRKLTIVQNLPAQRQASPRHVQVVCAQRLLVHAQRLFQQRPAPQQVMIIDSLQAAAPQGQNGKILNVTLKIKVFVHSQQGAAL